MKSSFDSGFLRALIVLLSLAGLEVALSGIAGVVMGARGLAEELFAMAFGLFYLSLLLRMRSDDDRRVFSEMDQCQTKLMELTQSEL